MNNLYIYIYKFLNKPQKTTETTESTLFPPYTLSSRFVDRDSNLGLAVRSFGGHPERSRNAAESKDLKNALTELAKRGKGSFDSASLRSGGQIYERPLNPNFPFTKNLIPRPYGW